jgi:hypothetical protein
VDFKDFITSEAEGEGERLWIRGLESNIFQPNLSRSECSHSGILANIRGEAKNHEEAQKDRRVHRNEHGWVYRAA